MEPKRFNDLVNATIAQCKDVMSVRKHEYSREADRLHNFKRAAAFEQTTPEKALVGMWSKHLVSILDMVDDLDSGMEHPIEEWEGKLHDSINYHLLLKGLLVERAE